MDDKEKEQYRAELEAAYLVRNQEYILSKRTRLEEEQTALGVELTSLQDYCEHPNVNKENKANTGNYDPSADHYWKDCKCPDCGKWWREDQ